MSRSDSFKNKLDRLLLGLFIEIVPKFQDEVPSFTKVNKLDCIAYWKVFFKTWHLVFSSTNFEFLTDIFQYQSLCLCLSVPDIQQQQKHTYEYFLHAYCLLLLDRNKPTNLDYWTTFFKGLRGDYTSLLSNFVLDITFKRIH